MGVGVGVRLLTTLTPVLPVLSGLSGPARTLGRAIVLPLVSPLGNIGTPGIIRRDTIRRRTGSVDFDTVPCTLQAAGYVAARLLVSSGHTPPPVVNLCGHDMPNARIGSAPALVAPSLPGSSPVDLDLFPGHNTLGTCEHAARTAPNDTAHGLDRSGCTRTVERSGRRRHSVNESRHG